jgi:hypothetical protein
MGAMVFLFADTHAVVHSILEPCLYNDNQRRQLNRR